MRFYPGKRVLLQLWHDWMKSFVVMAVIIFPLKSVIADWNYVPTGSMKPTILEGDMLFVNKLSYDLKVPFTLWRLGTWAQPKRGDVAVFFSPVDGMRLVKRVIGVPGDRIAMKNNVIFLNGKPLDYAISSAVPFVDEIYEDAHPILARESSGDGSHWVMALPSRGAMRSFPEITVPEGKYFMMGDSRDNSLDSRFIGFVGREQIVGKVNRVLLSFDKNHYYVPRIARFFASL